MSKIRSVIVRYWGPSDNAAQTFVHPHVWLAGMILGLPLLLFSPVHILLRRYAPKAT